MKIRAVIAAVLIGVLGNTSLLLSGASAVSASGFKAGNIMDDSVMTDYTSMTKTDIQNFLNSKVPTCDTNGQQLSEYGGPDLNNDGKVQRWEWGKANYNQTTFPCLRNYTQNSKSAAQIIYDVAQEFHINPKVLIVLLQKEQGLVTDTWPLNIQYRSATGYGCPDNGSCATKYYGLTQQLTWAATMFHTIVSGDSNWSNNYGSGTSWYAPYTVGNNTIYWNPSTSCGTSTVNILNRTTAALYSYTPYRPNSAALNAGYGSGNSCSSYGNRNFYLYFTEWFGSTNIPLFKISGGGDAVYLSYGDSYYAFPSMDVYKAWGFEGEKIQTVDPTQLSSYTKGPDLARLVKFGASPAVYMVDKGNIFFVPDWPTVEGYGYTSSDTVTYSDDNLKSILSSKGTITKLARESNGRIFFVDGSGKHEFPDFNTFSNLSTPLAGTTNHNTFSDDLIKSITNSYPILLDGKIVKAKDSPAIYIFNNGELHWFSSDTWNSWGRPLDYGHFVNSSLSQLPTSTSPVSATVTDGIDRYLVNDGKRYMFTPTLQTNWGLANDEFVSYPTEVISRLASGGEVGNLIRSSSGTVYVVRNGEKIPIASLGDFNLLGFSWKDVRNLPANILNLIPTSTSVAFGPTSIIRLPNGGIYLIDDNLTAYLIPSMDIYNAFRLTPLRQFSSDVMPAYSKTNLYQLIKNESGTYYLVDNGKKLWISSSTYSTTQYNLGGAPVTTMSNKLLNSISNGPSLSNFIQGSSPTVYKVENGQKHPLSSPASLFSHGGNWNIITKTSDSFLNTLPTGGVY